MKDDCLCVSGAKRHPSAGLKADTRRHEVSFNKVTLINDVMVATKDTLAHLSRSES